jgi:hypothetical protein
MGKLIINFLFILFAMGSQAQETTQVDPYHKSTNGFGYSISADAHCTVWWAEGAYKVMRDMPVPSQQSSGIQVWSAKNEYESFIVVINPKLRLENFRIKLDKLTDSKGNTIEKANITIRKVEYVKVTKPTDSYGFTGWWPDPLPLVNDPETLIPTENQPFWITIKVPENALAGDYSGKINLSSGTWSLDLSVKLHVWNFSLPKSPAMRSGFGMSMNDIAEYENLTDLADKQKVFDYYMESFRDYKISPYDPFLYTPVRENISGVAWQGGLFDSREKYSGNYSYKLVDNLLTKNTEGSTKDFIPIKNPFSLKLVFHSKSVKDKQQFIAGIECYNTEKELIVFENRFEIFTGETEWKAYSFVLDKFDPEVKYIKIKLFPSNRTKAGEDTGTVWFDELQLVNESGQNEFQEGDFETDLNKIDISLDFSDLNKAGKKYFDEFGFTGYSLSLKGLGGGTYYSRESGVFEGFEQGTSEYNKLMEKYLAQMQDNLEKNGWLGKEYVYWFDEPGESDYPFVKETNALIKKYAPKITTFLTEHVADQDISDVTDISCTIWHKLSHDKIKKMNEKGLEHWSYLCCWPKSPWISEFIDHDAVNMRMWLWASWQHQLKGILIWSTTYWNSDAASPAGYLQNPWEEAMSYVTGYGWPLGKQTIWGNGDGRLYYPNNRNPNTDTKSYIGRPVPSIRLEFIRDGIEDFEYFSLLEKAVAKNPSHPLAKEAGKLLEIPKNIYTDEKTYSKNPQDMLEYRKKIAGMLEELNSSNNKSGNTK